MTATNSISMTKTVNSVLLEKYPHCKYCAFQSNAVCVKQKKLKHYCKDRQYISAKCKRCLYRFDIRCTEKMKLDTISNPSFTCPLYKETQVYDIFFAPTACSRGDCKFCDEGFCSILNFSDNGKNCSFYKKREQIDVEKCITKINKIKRLRQRFQEPDGMAFWVNLLNKHPEFKSQSWCSDIVEAVLEHEEKFKVYHVSPKVFSIPDVWR